jgi:hypothetical protein
MTGKQTGVSSNSNNNNTNKHRTHHELSEANEEDDGHMSDSALSFLVDSLCSPMDPDSEKEINCFFTAKKCSELFHM